MDNNDFILKILAELEDKGIKTGYDKLKKQLEKDPAKIDVILDTSGTLGRTKGSVKKLAAELHNELSVEINKLKKQGHDINLDLSVGDVEKVINNVITQTDKLEKEFDSATSKAQKFLAQFNNKSGGVLVNSAEFKAVQTAIDGLGDTHSIDDLNKAMNNLETTYNNMVSNLRNGGKSLNPFINAINDMKNMDSTLKGIELDFQSLASKPKTVADAIKDLHTQQSKVNQYSQGTVEWAQEYGILQSKIVAVKNEIQNVAKAEKASNTDESNKVKYYQRIIDNNKTIYSLKNKLLTADVRQTEEIDKQITKLEKRNQYNYGQLNKKGLTDNSWEQIVNGSKDALESQLRINSAKQEDIANTKAVAQAEKERIATLREQEALQKNLDKIQHSTDISDLETKYKKFGMVSEEVENNLKELKSAQEAVFKAQGTDGLGTALENYKTKLAETKASVKELTTTQISMGQRVSQMTEMQDWMRKNKAATELCGDKIDELIQKCKTCDAVEFNNIKSEFKEIKVAAGEAGKLGNTFLGSIKEQASKFVQWFSITSVVMEGVQAIKKMTQEVIAVNSAMIELRKVSDASNNDLKNYFDEAAKSAKDLGAAVSDVISATADWSRLGYSLDDSKKLAEVAILYKNVGDGIDVDTANESLVSTLRGFQLSAEDAMNIVDQFNEVANNFPIDSAGIGEALQRSAASFYEANTDLSKSIALITGTNSVIQDPDSVGTMWKTVSMRIRGATAELEEAGLETEGMVETTSQLQALVKGMTGFDIMKDEDTFKDIYEIVIGIGNEWQNLSDIEQANNNCLYVQKCA